MKATYQIDLIPQLEDGLWVVREELLINDNPDNTELLQEHKFSTEKKAEAFIDRWAKKHHLLNFNPKN